VDEFISYSRQSITQGDIAAVVAALKSDFLTQGPLIEEFESRISELTGAKHAIAVCNATAALHIACLSLNVGPGDVVWTVPNSFVASANCALYCGAEVDFVDIHPITRNICLDALGEKLDAANRAQRLPKVIIPVDFSGLPCPMPEIAALARRFGVKVIEDASHALGASIYGVPVGGSWADIVILSFHAVKIITSAEGGMCLTNNDELAHRLRNLRTHGITRNRAAMLNPSEDAFYYEQIELGFNYRITDLQAALGTSQLQRISQLQADRERLTRRYDQLLSELPVKLPARVQGYVSAHHLYVIELLSDVPRSDVFNHLRRSGIGANVHYIPIHIQPYYARFGFKRGMYPISEQYYDRAITIPLFPDMTELQQNRVVAALEKSLV
jgi:UDP-4-amino-4,6-dideoxy-N-acetyl-beta-L-altrosamine transaminase